MAKEELVREYEENGITMQERKITTKSGITHIVITAKSEPVSDLQPVPPAEYVEPLSEKLSRIERQNLLILDALTADGPSLTEEDIKVDIYTELIRAGRRNLKDVPESLKESVSGKLQPTKE